MLSVKVGIGVGQISILHMGGVLNRLEYVAVGDPLVQAFQVCIVDEVTTQLQVFRRAFAIAVIERTATQNNMLICATEPSGGGMCMYVRVCVVLLRLSLMLCAPGGAPRSVRRSHRFA